MSGTPKYCEAELDLQRREQLEQERRRQAADEARRRSEAEERERRRRLEAFRAIVGGDGQHLFVQIQGKTNELFPQDAEILQRKCSQLIAAIQSDQTESKLYARDSEVRQLLRELSDAAARKRIDDEEKKRVAEFDRLMFHIAELERRWSEVSQPDAAKFDSNGAVAVGKAIAESHRGLASASLERAKTAVERADDCLRKHLQAIETWRERWLHRRNKAEQSVEDLRAHIEGLRADPVLMRWRLAAVAELQGSLDNAAAALAAEHFDEPPKIAERVQQRSPTLINEANLLQIEADQRNYITSSIAKTLQEMGFLVSAAWQEDPANPSSPMRLDAVNSADQNIYVSVPVHGQVMYTVGGYPMTTEAVTGGGRSAACDKAEEVLMEMQEGVRKAFGVEMGEIMWEEKDPNRTITMKRPQTSGHKVRGA